MDAIAFPQLLPCPTSHIVVTRIRKVAVPVIGRLHIEVGGLKVFNMLVQIVAISRMSGNAASDENKLGSFKILV